MLFIELTLKSGETITANIDNISAISPHQDGAMIVLRGFTVGDVVTQPYEDIIDILGRNELFIRISG